VPDAKRNVVYCFVSISIPIPITKGMTSIILFNKGITGISESIEITTGYKKNGISLITSYLSKDITNIKK